jgi:AcrR family transcriptional regulator
LEVGKRTRLDPRREATQTALIEAAEMMFAGAGVDGISTRQIGAAIGSLNTNVVAYHFGSKHALIDAIFRHRLSAIDRRRAALLIEADKDRSAESIHGFLNRLMPKASIVSLVSMRVWNARGRLPPEAE